MKHDYYRYKVITRCSKISAKKPPLPGAVVHSIPAGAAAALPTSLARVHTRVRIAIPIDRKVGRNNDPLFSKEGVNLLSERRIRLISRSVYQHCVFA